MSLSPASMLARKRSWMLLRLKSLGQWSTRVSPSRATTVVSSNHVLMVVSDSSSRNRARIMSQISETDCIEALLFSVVPGRGPGTPENAAGTLRALPMAPLRARAARSSARGGKIPYLLYQKFHSIANTYSNNKIKYFPGKTAISGVLARIKTARFCIKFLLPPKVGLFPEKTAVFRSFY